MRHDPTGPERTSQRTIDAGPRNGRALILDVLRRILAIVHGHRRRHAASREFRHLSASLRMDLGLQPDDQTRRFD